MTTLKRKRKILAKERKETIPGQMSNAEIRKMLRTPETGDLSIINTRLYEEFTKAFHNLSKGIGIQKRADMALAIAKAKSKLKHM